MKFFVTFSGHNSKCLSSLVLATTKGPFWIVRTVCVCVCVACVWCVGCVPTFDISTLNPFFTDAVLTETKPAQYKHSARVSSSLYFPPPIYSSDPKETLNSLDGKIGGFTSLIPVPTISLIGLIFDQKGILFCCFASSCIVFLYQRHLGQVNFLP